MLNQERQASRFSQRLFYVTAIILISVLILAAGFDWQISQFFGNMNDPISTTFQDIGLWTSPLVVMLACNIVAHAGVRASNWPWYVRAIAVVGSALFAGYELWSGYLKYAMMMVLTSLKDIQAGKPMGMANSDGGSLPLPGALSIGLFILLYVLVCGVAQYWLARKSDEDLQHLVRVALVAALVVLLADTVINTMKTTWGRFRPYELLAGDPTKYTPWFHINGADGHMSFPSGHTETAALSLLFPLFVDRKNARLQRLVFWLAYGYGITMAITRVRILAHFTGDVTTSLVIVWSVILLVTTVANLPLVNWAALPQRRSSKSTQTTSPATE